MEKPKFKTVQEVVAAGEGVPQRYLYSSTGDDEIQPLNGSVPEMKIPTINLSLLLSSSDDAQEELVNFTRCSLHGALFRFEFDPLSDESWHYRSFTRQDLRDNQEILRACNRRETEVSDDQVLDWIDLLYITTYPEDKRQLKFWPQVPIEFRETLHEYTMKLHQVVEIFFKALSRSLKLEDNCFLEMCGEDATMETRFNMYPRCPRPENILGAKAHADGSAITLLLPDKDVEGLQFLKDGKWYKAPIVPYAMLINVGDMMEIMSNGIYKSPLHRVMANKEKERISVATFYNVDQDKEIQPVDGLVSEARPRLYKAIKNYEKIFFDYYQRGRRPIEAAMI